MTKDDDIVVRSFFAWCFQRKKSSLNQRNCSQESNESLCGFFLFSTSLCCWNDKEIRLENAHRQADQSDYCYVRVCLFVCQQTMLKKGNDTMNMPTIVMFSLLRSVCVFAWICSTFQRLSMPISTHFYFAMWSTTTTTTTWLLLLWTAWPQCETIVTIG